MAMKPCPDCGAGVSTLATQCVKCGRPVATMIDAWRQADEEEDRRQRQMPWKVALLVGMVCVFGIGIAWSTRRETQAAATPADPPLLAGQLSDHAGAPGPNWVRILPGQNVFAASDSIRKLGSDAYRAVIITELTSTWRSVDTDEIRCSQHTARTIRTRHVGKHARDESTPDDPFEAVYRGGPADIKYQNVCALARAKFSDATVADMPAPPRKMSDEEAKAGFVRLAFALDMTNKFRAKGFTLTADGATATDLRVDCPKCTSDMATQFGADDNIQATSRRLGFKRIIFNAGQYAKTWTL